MPLLREPDRERGFTRERIIRVLLNDGGGNLTKYRVAQLAEASEPWTRQYTDKLEEKGLVRGTEVVNPVGLYEEWLEIRIPPNEVTVSLQQPMTLLQETELEYSLTTYRAENMVQGLLFASTTDFYIPPDEISDWLALVEERGLLGGGNTRIRVLDSHVFYQQQRRDGYPLVSTPQLILDLLDEGGPCEAAADRLIDSFHGSVQ